MSEMVERVGLAITAAGMEWKAANGGDSVSWADIPDEVFARAAIEAMREPTWQMRDTAMYLVEGDTSVQASHNTKRVWQDMIDQALK